MITKAMVFAAGIGTRLRPFTDHCPKALVEVGGVPMLRRVIDKLINAGITEIVVNVHHFADQIKEYLESNRNFGIEIHISDESDKLLDTGGGILKAAGWLENGDSPFLVHNADILTDFDIKKMLHAHESQHRDVTLLCDERTTSRYFLFDSNMRLRGWTNKKNGEVKPAGTDISVYNLRAFGGVHLIQPTVISAIRSYCHQMAAAKVVEAKEYSFSITDFYIDYCGKLNIGGYQPAERYVWHDIGKPESLRIAEEQILSAKSL